MFVLAAANPEVEKRQDKIRTEYTNIYTEDIQIPSAMTQFALF